MKNPELVGLVEEFKKIDKDTLSLTQGLSHAQLVWRPNPSSWSIAECLDHLSVTGELYLEDIIPLVRKGRAKGVTGEGPFRHGMIGNWFYRSLEPPGKFKVKAPPLLAPSNITDGQKSVSRFMDLQKNIVDTISATDGLNTSKLKARSRIIKPLRMDVFQWLAAAASHERRHLWQARNVRNSENFPKN